MGKKKKIKILIENNNMYKLEGDIKILTKLYKEFKLKNPNAFFLRKSMPRGWDGCTDYITDRGTFRSGLYQMVCNKIIELGCKPIAVDNRMDFPVKPKLKKKIGNKVLRPEQCDAVKALIENEVGGINHFIAVYDAATNFGKTTLMAGIYYAFKKKIPAIVLINDGDLFEQFKRELPELIPQEDLGFVRGKDIRFNKFTVVMVQTLSPRVKEYVSQLAKFGIALVDEAELGTSKSYKNILNQLINVKVRVGLSGSIYKGKLAKHKTEHMSLRSYFGDVIYKITKLEMVEKGYSTPVTIRLYPGSQLESKTSYPIEYKENITQNKARIKVGIQLMKKAVKLKRIPALVIFQFHGHGELIYKMYRKAFPKLKVGFVHGDVKNRKEIIKDFTDGKIDILVGSYILKRGKNMPLLRYIQNHASGDSQETVMQIMGRGERTHESKKKYFLDDFMDKGKYLARHSKHRRNYYKEEGFKLIEYKE